MPATPTSSNPPPLPHHFEDFQIGDVVLTPPRTITRQDVLDFARLSGDHNPLHTDAEFARSTPMGRPVAHGLLVLSVATGLSADTGQLTGTALAFLGLEDWRFLAPIFYDEAIRLRWTVLDKRLASNGRAGVLRRTVEILKDDDTVAQRGVFTTLVRLHGH